MKARDWGGDFLMGRCKGVIGPKLKARLPQDQKAEARIGVRVLDHVTERDRPKVERAA